MPITPLRIPDRFYGQPIPVAPDMNQVIDKVDELVAAVNAGLATSNAIVGGDKFVQYTSSQTYGVPADALTLDRLDPATILPGVEATVINPHPTPLTDTAPTAYYRATIVPADTAGAVLVPAFTGSPDKLPIAWVEVVSNDTFTPLLANELNPGKAAYAGLELRPLLIAFANGIGTGTTTVVTTPATTPTVTGPTVTGFLPASAAMGASVTLTGTGFTKATAVLFNGTPASFQPINATTLVAVVPVGATTGPVAVTTSAGTGTSAASFTVGASTTTPTPTPELTAALAISLASLTLGASVSYSVTPAKGTAPYAYEVVATDTSTGQQFTLGNTKTGSWTPTAVGSYAIEATVTDSSSPAQVAQSAIRYLQVVQATNRIPVADAGTDLTVQLPTSSAALMGRATDPDGDAITAHAWRQITGPSTATGMPATSQNVLVSNLVAGTYQFGYRATDSRGGQSDEDYVLVTVQAAGGTGGGKPKKLVYMGDSLVNPVLTTTSRATARLSSSALQTAVISHPGEGVREWLNGHLSESAAAVDSAKDCYALVSEDTNGLNQYYIDQVKADALALANALLDQGYKGIVWMQVAACKSPYAYARNAQGNIIGSSVAEKQAGFDSARKAYNAYLQTLVGTKLYAVGDLSVYPNVYNQVNATDSRYFYPAGQGPYGSGEPGNVHYTDYGARYWGEAAAQAAAPMLGITLNPATITIPDAPDPGSGGSGSGDPTYISSPQTLDYVAANSNTAYVSGVFTKVSGGLGWNAAGLSRQAVDFTKYAVGQKLVIEYDEPGINSGGIFGTVEPAAYKASPTDIYKGTLCFYYDSKEYAVWINSFAFGTIARLPGKPRIEITRGATQDTVNFYVGTKAEPVYALTGRITGSIQFATYLGNDSTGADGASTTPACVITGEKIYIA